MSDEQNSSRSGKEHPDFGNYKNLALEGTAERIASMRELIVGQERFHAYVAADLQAMRNAIAFAERRIARQRFRLVFGSAVRHGA